MRRSLELRGIQVPVSYALGALRSREAVQCAVYHELASSPFKVTIDQEKHIGASFIEKAQVAHLKVIYDVVYAKPGVKTLEYDVYSPKGAKNLPFIIIIHDGGWTANDEDIMRGMARELTRSGRYEKRTEMPSATRWPI